MGYYSKRDYTTKEERAQMVIDKGNPKNSKLNKITEYMKQPNVKEFNARVVDKSFKNNRMGRPQIFDSREECEEEVQGYFKLCYDYDMIPTISSMALYFGITRDALYEHVSQEGSNFKDILKKAISTCQSYQELPALDGTLSAPTWIFTAKNYFGMKDTQNVDISATNQQQTNTNTINIIKEQIANENSNNFKVIEHDNNN